MEGYIVKVKSCCDDDIEYGTGIVIGENLVITPSHVLSGDKHYLFCNDKDIEATCIKENECGFSLIQTQEKLSEIASIFTDDDVLDCETEWSIHGFITEMQTNHEMSGKGIHNNEIINEQQNWNSILLNISSGSKNNYRGLSGSPVFANSRIVGIIQRQEIVDSGNTELKMATVSMFKDLLPADVIAENEYKIQLLKMVTEHTVNEIQKNKTNKKYIPNIYVEESYYKEKVRYFAEPSLFIKKSLDDLMQFDLTKYNEKLLEKGISIIDFSKYKHILESDDYTDAVNELITEIKNCYDNMSHLRNYTSISDDYEKNWVIYNNSLQFRIDKHSELLDMTIKKYLILTKKAGQGKTNFLCDFTENFLLKKEYYVLYFNASSFSDNPMNSVLKFITLNNNYNIEYTIKILNNEYKKTKKPFIIVIDGLNENNHLIDFTDQIKLFLEDCEKYPFIKVLMTTRSEFFEERFGKLKEGLYHNKYDSVQMKNYSDEFKSRIFWGYLDFFNIQIIENSLSTVTFNKLTNDLLFMRFFCEVNANKRNLYMYDVYVYDVFEHYTDIKCKKYSEGVRQDSVSLLFNKIISSMINENNYTGVSTDNFSKESIQLLNEMIDNEVIFKSETKVKKGFLSKQIETVGFTFDEYRDYCITNYLLENYDDEEKILEFWQHMSDNKLTICEGVQKYLFYLSHTKYRESLFGIISKVPEYDKLYWNYIWNIEDKYVTDYDVQKWKKQIEENGSKMIVVIRNMISRFDCNYYTKINIKLFMHILDELLESSEEMFDSIVWLFPYKELNDYRYYRRNIAYYFNDIIQKLSDNIRNDFDIDSYKELLKFTIYIMKNEQYETCCLWNLFYQYNPKQAIKILEEMNSHKSQVIQGNTADILLHLTNRYQDAELQRLLDNNSCSRNTSMGISEFIKSILSDLEE